MENAYVTTLDFEETGLFLAAGYSDGTVSVYCREPHGTKFNLYVRFISHESEIVRVKWCKGVCGNLSLLSSDVNTTRLWKISRTPSNLPLSDHYSNVKIVLKRVFSQAPPPGSNILNTHSLSLNSDGEIFLTADELRIYLWHLQSGGKECFNVLDLAAELQSLQMLTEVMRAATFHPQQCNLLVYGTSTGAVRMCDLRSSALCEGLGLPLPPSAHPGATPKNPLGEYLVGISDLAFDPCEGMHLAARDYGGVTMWDLRATRRFLTRYDVLPSARDRLMSHLYDRYEVGAPLEQFRCCLTRTQNNSVLSLITGTYDDQCIIWDVTSASAPDPDPTVRHKTVHVGKPKPAPRNLHVAAQSNRFPDFADTSGAGSLWKRRKFGSKEAVNIYPDNELMTNDDEQKRKAIIHTHHDTYYQNKFGDGPFFGGEEDEDVIMDSSRNQSNLVGEYAPDDVESVFNPTPEFMAVVPFSNSCISYFTNEDDGGTESDCNYKLSSQSFSSQVTAITADQQGELLALSARGSLFVYNTTR